MKSIQSDDAIGGLACGGEHDVHEGGTMKTAFSDEQSIAAPADTVWTRLTDW